MGDACLERVMQLVCEFEFVELLAERGPLCMGMIGDVFFPLSKLSPRLNSFSKLPRMRVPAPLVLSLPFPYGLVEDIEGLEVTVAPRGRAPIGSSGSRLCFGDFGGTLCIEWRSSVEDRPKLSPSVSCMPSRGNGPRCTGIAASDDTIEPGLAGRAKCMGDDEPLFGL